MSRYKAAEIARLQAELADVREAISRAVQNGQQRSITGSHTVSEVNFRYLTKRENVLVGKILAMQGARRTSNPDFANVSNT